MPDYPANDDQPAAKASGSLTSFFGETGTTTTENTMRIFLFGLSIAAIATANVAEPNPASLVGREHGVLAGGPVH